MERVTLQSNNQTRKEIKIRKKQIKIRKEIKIRKVFLQVILELVDVFILRSTDSYANSSCILITFDKWKNEKGNIYRWKPYPSSRII